MKRDELLIEADELKELINDPNLRLFDTTVVFDPSAPDGREKYLAGHIPGAAFLDHATLSDTSSELRFTLPDQETLEKQIGQIGIANDSIVVLYSTEMIAWATRAWWVLKYAGHGNVRVLNGGMQAWQAETETTERSFEPATFSAMFEPGMIASRQEVMEAMANGGSCVVNTLPPDVYAGTAKVPYAGHIPGSVNQPLFELMDGHYLLKDEALTEHFAGRDPDERFITYCGGGIAATVNACAARLAGMNNVAVYDGSMSDWLAASLPVAKVGRPEGA